MTRALLRSDCVPLRGGRRSPWAALLAVAAAASALAQTQSSPGPGLPPLPDAIGRAGMAAAAVPLPKGRAGLLAVGGANFPERMPWDGGVKVFHRELLLLAEDAGGAWSWRVVGELPEPNAYAAFGPAPDGLWLAGGANAVGHQRAAWRIAADGQRRALPDLPQPIAYAACATDGERLFVLGGQEQPQSTRALAQVLVLRLDRSEQGWQRREWQGADRILGTAGIHDGRLWLIGGCRLAAGADGAPQRSYLGDAIAVRLADFEAGGALATCAERQLPHPIAASAGPALRHEGRLLFAGGDDGSHLRQLPQQHPGQRREWFAFDPGTGALATVGALDQGIACAPLVAFGDGLAVVSGETRPGVRTPIVATARLAADRTGTVLEAALLLAFLLLAVLRIGRGAARRPQASAPSGADPPLPPGAWRAVGLLFVVALLNYLDRQLLAATATPIQRDIPQSNAQFGLLTAVFLFVYAALSPLGGLLADRTGRRRVILVALVAWSAATWLTGRVTSYPQLLGARVLMGISEACYLPAALALITDFHRGRTRSLATGLHMSGIYAGQALAGAGGFLAERLGWRTAYSAFGLFGVVYALLLSVWLREPLATTGAATAAAVDSAPPPRAAVLLRGLLRQRAFWLLCAAMGAASIGNWFVLAWLPRLLEQRFALSLGAAGTIATLPLAVAKYCAVLGGGHCADRRAQRDPAGRGRLAAWTFLVAGPLIAATALLPREALALFVVLVAAQGVAQGVLDATLMPILRRHVDERAAATGYGCLNLIGAGLGGLSVLYGGALLDAGIPLSVPLAASGLGLLLCGVFLALLPATVSRDD